MKHYYSNEYSDYVLLLNDFKIILKENNTKEIELEEMKRDYGGEMWCVEDNHFIEKGECGNYCSEYSPRNGKSGRCRYLENGFIGTGKKFILTKNGLKESIVL